MYIWRGKNRRDRRENKLQGLFGWRAHPSVRNERLEDDILRQEQEEIHVGYFHQNIRVIMHNYLNSPNGLVEVSRIIQHLDEVALKKAVEEAEAAALESGEKFDKTKIVAVPAEIKKRSNVYEVFRKYDADGGGTLDMEELSVLLEELKIFMTEEELENLFDELDEDGEGGIDFEEFYNWFTAEADKQRKKNLVGYVANVISEGVFDGFRRLVMEVEARNLALDHAVWSAERDARAEFRIVHPPRFKCEKHTCGMSFPTYDQYRKHKDDVEGHEILDRDHEELVSRFHNMELFLAGPLGRISLANRLLFSRELASQETRIKAAEMTPYRPATLDPEHKRQAQQLAGMMVTGYDPKMGLRSVPRKRGLKTQHLAPGKTREQQALSDVISSLLHCRDESIDIVSAPTTSQHADVVFTWKGFAANKIEVMGNFNGWKGESLSPYLQIPAPPDAASTIEDDIKTIESDSSTGSKSGSYNDVSVSNQVKKSLTFGRSSIIKHLGPGKYLYKYRVDGEEKLDEHASITVDPLTGKEVNILLVINPILHHDKNKPKDDASTVGSQTTDPQEKFDKKFGHLVHLNSLHTPEYKAKRNEEVGGMTKINLRNMSLFDDGAWAFASFMQRNSLIQVLDVSFNGISDDGMQAIATALPLLTQLHTLKANGNGFGYDGVRYICGPLKKSQTIETLELSGNNMGDDGAEVIAKVLLPMHRYLRELYVDDNKIGNDGAKELGEGLLHNKYLETISVSKNLIYTEGCRNLCFAVQSNGVMKRIRLDNNPLGAAGGRHVGEMLLMNDSLEYVDVSNIDLNRANDGSGFTLINSAIEKNKVLRYLLLRNNGISDLQAVDIIQSIKANLSITHIDLEGNPISAHFFKPNHFFETKLGRATPSITTRLLEIQEIKRNPDAKKYKGKPREIDPEEDGKWTWRRKWKKIDRKAEIRRQKAAAGAEERENIELEKEYCDEQLEKYLVGVEAFLDNPDCEIFLSTIAKLLLQHFVEMHRVVPLESADANAGGVADDASVGSVHSGSEASLIPNKAGVGAADEAKNADDQSLASGASNSTQHTLPSAGSGAKLVMSTRMRKELEAKLEKEREEAERRRVKHGRDEDGMIPWDDQHFNSVHVAVCKAIFDDLGADLSSLFLPFMQMERALNMMCLPCNQTNLQKAVWACQVTNQPLISFKKFLAYTKNNAKKIVQGASFKRMRIKADLYFRPPLEEAKAIILDHYRYSAKIDIRKNYRAQLEHAPAFVCPTCHERFINQKSFDRHIEKGPRNTEHKRQILARTVHEAQTYFLRKSKFMVTGTYFPAFFELVPEHNLVEDYIPQVFDSMGEEGRPVGTVEPHEVQLVEDVLGDYLQISYEGRMGWVKYQLPHEKERYRRVLHKACVHDVPHFSWDNLQVNSKPIYYQVRNDPRLPSTFELKVRLRPVLDSEVVGTLYKGQIIESRAHVGDWLQIRFEKHDAAWVVMKVGGGQWKPPLTRLELKKKKAAEEEARREKERIRAEKIKALKAAQIKKRGKAKPIKLKEDDEKEVIIPAGELGAETVTVLHECVQRRMAATMAYSPYNPSKEELEVPEDWKWMEADRMEQESKAAMEEETVDDQPQNNHNDGHDNRKEK